MTFDMPIFINRRDRVTHRRTLVAWLERAGRERIVMIDNGSTYEPLLDYYAESPHRVIRLGENWGSRAIWAAGIAPVNKSYVYTDPDVIPIESCPFDAVEYLRELLGRYPDEQKAGLGLFVDDVPLCHRGQKSFSVSQIAGRALGSGVESSALDTSFAVHRAGTTMFSAWSLRTATPYQVRHMPWYVSAPDSEDRYYLERAVPGRYGVVLG